jgi:peroxiredoxin
MRWRAGVVGILGAALLGGCTGTDAVDQSAGGDNRFVQVDGGLTRYASGHRVPVSGVAGETLDGEKLDVAGFRGKVVVLNFWGQWCAPCRAEAKGLQEAYLSTKDRGVQFVGIDVRDYRQSAVAFERSYGITYPSLFDPDGRIALNFRKTPLVSTPQTFVLDRRGEVAAVFRKPVLPEDLPPVLDPLIAESA